MGFFRKLGQAIVHPIKTMRGEMNNNNNNNNNSQYQNNRKQYASRYEQSESKKIVDAETEKRKNGESATSPEAKDAWNKRQQQHAEAWEQSDSKKIIDNKLNDGGWTTDPSISNNRGGDNWTTDPSVNNNSTGNDGYVIENGMVDPDSVSPPSDEQRAAIEESVYTGTAFVSGSARDAVEMIFDDLPFAGKKRNDAQREECKNVLIGTISKMAAQLVPSGEYDKDGKEIMWNGAQAILNGMDYNDVWQYYANLFNVESDVLPYHEAVS